MSKDADKLALHAGIEYTQEEAETLRALGYQLVEKFKIAKCESVFLVAGYEAKESKQ